jgi:hypothetical protein
VRPADLLLQVAGAVDEELDLFSSIEDALDVFCHDLHRTVVKEDNLAAWWVISTSKYIPTLHRLILRPG